MTTIDLKSGAREPWHSYQLALYCSGNPMPEVVFDEHQHRYFLDNRELPSVTKIVNPEPNKFYAPGSADRGHRVHRLCVLDAQGVLDDMTVFSLDRGYLQAWRRFVSENVAEFLTFEEIVGDPVLGYCGRRDVTLEMKAKGFPGCVLYLRKNGTYALEPFDFEQMKALVGRARWMVAQYHAAKRANKYQMFGGNHANA